MVIVDDTCPPRARCRVPPRFRVRFDVDLTPLVDDADDDLVPQRRTRDGARAPASRAAPRSSPRFTHHQPSASSSATTSVPHLGAPCLSSGSTRSIGTPSRPSSTTRAPTVPTMRRAASTDLRPGRARPAIRGPRPGFDLPDEPLVGQAELIPVGAAGRRTGPTWRVTIYDGVSMSGGRTLVSAEAPARRGPAWARRISMRIAGVPAAPASAARTLTAAGVGLDDGRAPGPASALPGIAWWTLGCTSTRNRRSRNRRAAVVQASSGFIGRRRRASDSVGTSPA